MIVNELKFNLHDSQLEKFTFGFRRDLTLTIVLDPVWNKNLDSKINLRFAAIENLEAVREFFNNNYTKRIAPNTYWDEIEELVLLDKKTCRLSLSLGFVDIIGKGFQVVP